MTSKLSESLLVVNADDFGMSTSATRGIARGHLDGIITSASLVATTDAYEEAVRTLKEECPLLGVGLHFTLTEGVPVSGRANVPDLSDEAGDFKWTFSSLFFAMNTARRAVLLEQIEIELRAQLDRLEKDGISIDHINSERHVHMIPEIYKIVVDVAAERGIPFVRSIKDVGWRYLNATCLDSMVRRGSLVKWALLTRFARINARCTVPGVKNPDQYASVLYTGEMGEILDRVIEDPPTGVTEVAVHPGIPGLGQSEHIKNPKLRRYLSSPSRRRELEACLISLEGRTAGRFSDAAKLADV